MRQIEQDCGPEQQEQRPEVKWVGGAVSRGSGALAGEPLWSPRKGSAAESTAEAALSACTEAADTGRATACWRDDPDLWCMCPAASATWLAAFLAASAFVHAASERKLTHIQP
jgi:hypothetical protein